MIKRHVSFSQLVTMLRLTLMYYTDFISFMENPQNDELIIMAEKANSPPKELDLFD
ncbi:transposase [Prevotella intermedia]|nr:transposase [Prevotella intermedia]